GAGGGGGAAAIQRALRAGKIASLPAGRTITRILERGGVRDGEKPARRPPPPPGWYLPEVASKRQELDSFDVVEGLVIKGGPQIEVLNGVSLYGGLAASWPLEAGGAAPGVGAPLIRPCGDFGSPASPPLPPP